jgi:hypothetical protein
MIGNKGLVALLIDIMCFIIIFNHCGTIMELSEMQLSRLIITCEVFISSRYHLSYGYLLKLLVLFQVNHGPIPAMIISGLLYQLMNLNWLFFYLIKVFIVIKVWLWWLWDYETLGVCLILVIIIILLYHDLSHTEFNSAYFENFTSTYFEVVF